MTLYDSIILVYSFLLLYFLYFFRRGMPEELHTLSLYLSFSSSSYFFSVSLSLYLFLLLQ